MSKCIYCNSEDLSISDIIPVALTGTKVTKLFVCKKHNAFTNENFEQIVSSNLKFFRSSLGLLERSGKEIKYRADLIIDGITIPKVDISDRASIYEDKKRLFSGEKKGKKFLIGNVEKLKQKSGVNEEDIEIVQMKDVTINYSFSLEELFASDAMLRTIAKIAYEWHCYINDIEECSIEQYKDIIECILLKKTVSQFVEIVTDNILDQCLKHVCYVGNHGLFEYVDIDGYLYVIINFWGIVLYKVRIKNTFNPNTYKEHCYTLYVYHIDGHKSEVQFVKIGNSEFISLSANQAIVKQKDTYLKNLQELLTVNILTINKVAKMVELLRKDIKDYQDTTNELVRILDYESNERIVTIHLLIQLLNNQHQYNKEESFNKNLQMIYQGDDTVSITEEQKREFVNKLVSLHKDGELIETLMKAIKLFEEILINERSHNAR